MLFNSPVFLFAFLPLTWLLFQILGKAKTTQLAIGTLVVASLAFYSYWNPPFVALIIGSILFNFFVGRALVKRPRKATLILGVAANLATIAYFKYTGFFLDTINMVAQTSFPLPNIFLPLGISFFTFQQIAYLVDCYENKIDDYGFLDYALFVTFFPQLIAGPIVHHGEVMSQFKKPETFRINGSHLAIGLALLSMGLFKKVIIADSLSPWVHAAFDRVGTPTVFISWLGALSYTLQIYFDFSGYSEMALGLGYLFNIKLPVNFNAPYKATSIIDFWQRWHMTLSRFLKDYLYIPLGGNQKGHRRRYINLMLTMFLGGLWHGAAWTFVFWGVLHGLYLCINHTWRYAAKKWGLQMPAVLGWFITFISVVVAWVFFRADSFERAIEMLKGMFGLNGTVALNKSWLYIESNRFLPQLPFNDRIAFILAAIGICLFLPTAYDIATKDIKEAPIRTAIICAALFFVAVMGLSRVSEFLYFQF